MTKARFEITLTPAQVAHITQQITGTVVERTGLHDAITDTIMNSGKVTAREAISIADEVLALITTQPTVPQVKAQALEEAADAYQTAALSGTFTSREGYTRAWLRERAQQLKETK